MKKGTVSILGCGWLGLPLGKHLIESGFSVKGSVTSIEKLSLLGEAGILPSCIILSENGAIVDNPSFFETDVLIISIPPRRVPDIIQIFPEQVRHIVPYILMFGIQNVIFISSTSVYPELNQIAKEDDSFYPDKESGKALLVAEELLQSQTDFHTTILRFGGLIGADRNPARFLLKSDRKVSNTPVNLIHQDDCIGIISTIIQKDVWGETFNACSTDHPLKKDFYGKAAQISGLPEPLISDHPEAYKLDIRPLIRYGASDALPDPPCSIG